MVSRYGEFVLYRPRFSGATALLWLAPVLLFLCAAGIVYISLRRRQRPTPGEAPLNEADQQRLRRLLDEGEEEKS